MHVEQFLIEETVNLIYSNDDLAEWNKIVRELGLIGQDRTLQSDKSPIPFAPLNTRMENILSELLPSKIDVAKYDLTPIPLEVLKLISLSKNERYFGTVEIWYDEENKDPACIGITPGWWIDNPSGSKLSVHGAFYSKEDCQKFIDEQKLEGHKPYHYGGKKYILARWADVKQTWEQLAERARKIYVSREGARYDKEIKELQTKLANIQNDSVLRFG